MFIEYQDNSIKPINKYFHNYSNKLKIVMRKVPLFYIFTYVKQYPTNNYEFAES